MWRAANPLVFAFCWCRYRCFGGLTPSSLSLFHIRLALLLTLHWFQSLVLCILCIARFSGCCVTHMLELSATLTVSWSVEEVWSINGLCINLWLQWTVYVLWPRSHILASSGRHYRFSPDTVLEHCNAHATTNTHMADTARLPGTNGGNY